MTLSPSPPVPALIPGFHGFGIGDVVRQRNCTQRMLVVDLDRWSVTCAWPVNGRPVETLCRPINLRVVHKARK